MVAVEKDVAKGIIYWYCAATANISSSLKWLKRVSLFFVFIAFLYWRRPQMLIAARLKFFFFAALRELFHSKAIIAFKRHFLGTRC